MQIEPNVLGECYCVRLSVVCNVVAAHAHAECRHCGQLNFSAIFCTVFYNFVDLCSCEGIHGQPRRGRAWWTLRCQLPFPQSVFLTHQNSINIKTGNSLVDERRTLLSNSNYLLNYAIIVKLYHLCTHFPRNVRLSLRRIATFSAHRDFLIYCAL